MLNKRAKWKLPYIDTRFTTLTMDKKKSMRLRIRNSCISSKLLGHNIYIYNGQRYIALNIKKEMIGHKLGELAITKTLGYRTKKTKKQTKKNK